MGACLSICTIKRGVLPGDDQFVHSPREFRSIVPFNSDKIESRSSYASICSDIIAKKFESFLEKSLEAIPHIVSLRNVIYDPLGLDKFVLFLKYESNCGNLFVLSFYDDVLGLLGIHCPFKFARHIELIHKKFIDKDSQGNLTINENTHICFIMI